MEWSVVLRLLLAMFLGGVIGLEREAVNRPAGFRTYTGMFRVSSHNGDQ